MRGQSAKSRLFVLSHEAAIAEDIGAEYGGELTFQNFPKWIVNSSLQSGLAPVGSPVLRDGLILKGVYLFLTFYGEMRTNPHNFRGLGACLLPEIQFDICHH